MEPAPYLIDLAVAIADGAAIDWVAAESAARDAGERALIAQLRSLERVASVHATLPSAGTFMRSLHVTGFEDAGGRWGTLDIVRKIGGGAHADVYLAHDPRLDRPVALKLLRQRQDDRDASAAIDEARLLARVRHPNVVTVYGAERIDGRTGIWMEYVEGRTLEEELRASGPFPAEELQRVGIAVCDALAAVHAAGLLHRDVKAQNVLRDASGRVLLSDFGTGREAAAGISELAGTPLYLAPEVLDGQPASERSDLYGVGVLLFHLATGAFPVAGRSIADLRDAHRSGGMPDLKRGRPDLPGPLRACIERALDRDASKRWASVDAFRAALCAPAPGARRAARPVVVLAAFAAAIALLAASTVGLETGGVAGSWLWPRATPPVASQLTASNSSRGGISAAAISPDGSRLLYADPGGLYEQDMAGDTPFHLKWTPPAEVTDLSWFPGSGTFLVAAAGSLWRAAVGSASGNKLLDDVNKVSVSPDGGHVALTRAAGGLWIADQNAANARALMRPQANVTYAKATWAPDGSRLAFIEYDASRPQRRVSLRTVRPDGTGLSTVLTAPSGTGFHQVIWTPDGRLLFTRPLPPPRARYTNLWSIAVDSATGEPLGQPAQITDYPDFNFVNASVTADGGRLVFVRNHHSFEIVTADLDPRAEAMTEPQRSVTMNSDLRPLAWTPDGVVLFRSLLIPRRIYVAAAGAIAPAEFLHDDRRELVDAAVTPDRRWVVHLAGDRAGTFVFRATPDGGQPERLLPLPGEDAALRCARENPAVCTAGVRDGNLLTLSTFDPDTGRALPPIAFSPVMSVESWDLSPDGTAIAIVPASGPPRVHVVDVRTREAQDVGTGQWRGYGVSWLADSTGWLFTTTRGQGGDVVIARRSGPPRVLWSSDWQRLSSPLVSPDGRRIAFLDLHIESNVWMLRHF